MACSAADKAISSNMILVQKQSPPAQAAIPLRAAETSKVSGNEAQVEKGKALRAALEAEYDRRAGLHELKIAGNGVNDVTGIVEKFISPGEAMAVARRTLHAAGFVFEPHLDLGLPPFQFAIIHDFRFVFPLGISIAAAIYVSKDGARVANVSVDILIQAP
jgi:hypothetical protein